MRFLLCNFRGVLILNSGKDKHLNRTGKTIIPYFTIRSPKKLTGGLLTLLAALCLTCNQAVQSDLPPEPADPDPVDMDAWKEIEPGIYSGFGSVDLAYPRSTPPSGKMAGSITLAGWKGERVHCQLLVWSKGKEEQVSIHANGFRNGSHVINEDRVSVSVLRYVLTDEFLNERSTSCGPRDNNLVPAHLSPDLMSEGNSFISEDQGTRPVWISIDIPPDAPAGTIYCQAISIGHGGPCHHPGGKGSFTATAFRMVFPPGPLAKSFCSGKIPWGGTVV
jgi:hypothetical protein